MTPEDQFWAVLTHKRDEGLAHLTGVVERSGPDEFCGFLMQHVVSKVTDEHGETDTTEYLIACCALVGAVDALMAWKEMKAAT